MTRKFIALCVFLLAMTAPTWAENIDVGTDTKEWTDGNNYIVSGNVTIGDRIYVKGSVTLILNDGCQLVAEKGIDAPEGNSLTIKAGGPDGSGELIANGDANCAGIGGGHRTTGGNITIEGGRINASGGHQAAGIGGGAPPHPDFWRPNGGNIRILGGRVNASGGHQAAGIGGGHFGGGGNIRILGGTVNATGRDGAAGIGGGWEGSGGTIKISGGTVNASGGEEAAGIGGGKDADGGNITIIGGIVNARGGKRAAGIGGGWNPQGGVSGGTITISGGIVEAYGHGGGAGIGRGEYGSDNGTLSSGTDGSAWIITSWIGANRTGFTSGVMFLGDEGTVLGNPTIETDVDVLSGKTLTIPQGATLTVEGGAELTNNGQIINMGTVILSDSRDRDDIKELGMLDGMLDGKDLYGIVKIGAKEYTNDGGDVVRDTFTMRKHKAIENGTQMLMRGVKLYILKNVMLTILPSQRLIVADGVTLPNGMMIRNTGFLRLPAGTDLKRLKLGGPGYILMGGKMYNNKGEEVKAEVAMPMQMKPAENAAVKNAIGKYLNPSVTKGLAAAEEEEPEDGRAEVKFGDILIYTDADEGSLRAMKVDVAAEPNEHAVIAKGQMGDDAYGDVKDGKIVYVNRFFAPNDETESEDIKFDEVPASEAGTEELDLTTVVVNGKADEEVRELKEYIPSGLADGQGLVVYYDEETKVYVLIIFDGDETDGVASAHICAKEAGGGVAPGSGGGSSGCSAGFGMAALLALGLFGIKKRRR